jgi:lipocalin-like protein
MSFAGMFNVGEPMIKLALILLGSLIVTQRSVADDSPRLIGVWKLLSFQSEFQDGSPTRAMFGEHPSGYIILTKEGRMMSVIEGENRKAPQTDADRASLLNSLIAYSGKYRIDGSQWILAVDVAWNPAWDGTEQVRSFELAGDRLTVTSPWQHAPNFPGAPMSRGIVVFERIK